MTSEAATAYKPSACPVLAQDGRNYLQWKTLIPIILRSDEDVWEMLQGEEKKPTPIAPSTELTENQKKVLNQYYKKSFKGIQLITPYIDPKLSSRLLYKQTEDTMDILELYNKIKEEFVDTSGIMQSAAITRLQEFKFDKKKSIEQNLITFNNMLTLLRETGAPFDSTYMMNRLINSLGPEWASFRYAWIMKPKADQTLSNLLALLKGEACRMAGPKAVEEATALIAEMGLNGNPRGIRPSGRTRRTNFRRRPQRQNNSQTNQSTRRCYKCGAMGHFQNECRQSRRNDQRFNARGRGRGGTRGRNQNRSARTARANLAEAFMVSCAKEKKNSSIFIIDSGASHHVTNNSKWFKQFQSGTEPREVRVASKHCLKVYGQGTVGLTVKVGDDIVEFELGNVLFVPAMRKNLVSVSQLTKDNFEVTIKGTELLIKKGELSIPVQQRKGLYQLQTMAKHEPKRKANGLLVNGHAGRAIKTDPNLKVNSDAIRGKLSMRKLHELFAHLSPSFMKQCFERYNIECIDDFEQCESCVLGKQTKHNYRTRPKEVQATEPGTVSADLCSPATPSLGNANHSLMITDEFSKFRKVYFIKTKDETADCI